MVLLADLSQHLGITLYAKLESQNPTGTFKDREASLVVSRLRAARKDNLVVASTGNTGMAVSYYAGQAHLKSYCFLPLWSQYKLIGPLGGRNNRIILVDGSPIDVKNYAARFAEMHEFPRLSPLHERSEAYCTQAYEVGEEVLSSRMPNIDYYVQTIAAGVGPIGFFKGMARVGQWTSGRICMPRIIGVQISECALMQRAWAQGAEKINCEATTPEGFAGLPFEPTLHTPNASACYPSLHRTIKASGGTLTAVTPEAVRWR